MEQKFTLKKLTVETLGVSCQYEIQTTKDDGAIETAIYQKKDSRIPHNGLRFWFETALAQTIAKIFHYDEPGFALNQIVPTTIKFSGKGENIGISISGHFIFGLLQIQFKTAKIKYLAGDNEICARLTGIVSDIEKEIQKYLFEGATENVEIFGE